MKRIQFLINLLAIFFCYSNVSLGKSSKRMHHRQKIKDFDKEKSNRTANRYYKSSKYRTMDKCKHCSRWCQNDATPWSWFEGLQLLFGANGSVHFHSPYAWTIVNPKVNNLYWLTFLTEVLEEEGSSGDSGNKRKTKDMFGVACIGEKFSMNFQGTLRYVMGRAISGMGIDISFGQETLLDANFDYKKIIDANNEGSLYTLDYINENILKNNKDDLLKTAVNGKSKKTEPSKIKITSKCIGVDVLFLHDYWSNDVRLVEDRGKRLYGSWYGYFGLGCKFNLATKIEDDSLPFNDQKFKEKYTKEMINTFIPRIKIGTNIIMPNGISLDINCIINLRSNFSEKYAFHNTVVFNNIANIKNVLKVDLKKRMLKLIQPIVKQFFTHDLQFNVMLGYDFYPLLKDKFSEYDEDQYDEID